MKKGQVTIIRSGNQSNNIDLKELWFYKDLFYFLILRNIKSKYAQSVIGVGWAIIKPLFSMVIFTIIFGNLAKIDSNGVPYSIFSYTALVPWIYFSNSLSHSGSSLISSANMLSKIYFPRLVIPLTPVISNILDFIIAFSILLVMMTFYGFFPTLKILLIPFLVLVMILTASGFGMWISALALQYRDLKFAMAFFIQLLMYLAPVIYPANYIPENMRLLYGCFPIVGVIEGFRAALLGTNPIPWDFIIVGFITSIFIFISGAFHFRKVEKYFADII